MPHNGRHTVASGTSNKSRDASNSRVLAVRPPATAVASKATLTIQRPKKSSVDFVSAVTIVYTLVGVSVAVALLLLLASQFMLDFYEGLRAVFRAIFSSVSHNDFPASLAKLYTT